MWSAAVILVGSVVSVVAYQTVHSSDSGADSPLFAVRTQRATNQENLEGVSLFLGKGRHTTLFNPSASNQDELIQTAIKFFTTHPAVFTKLLEKLDHYPYLTELLTKYNIKSSEFEYYLHLLQKNPGLVTEETMKGYFAGTNTDPAQPLGLSTSNPLGCFIVAVFALMPVAIVLTLLLLFFTLRILTCMNVNNCANDLAQSIWDQMIQGLTQP